MSDLSQEFLPRIVKVDNSCGCTLTRASITGLTPGEFEALAGKEIELAKVIANTAEAKALGVQERGIATLLKSSIRNVKPSLNKQKFEEQSLILPYIQRRQRHTVNANYFNITAGIAHPQAGTGDIPANAVQFTVNLGNSPWRSPLTNIERQFLPGMTVIVMTWDNNTDKTAKTIQYEIIDSVNADAGSDARAIISVAPLGRTAPGFTPEYGIVQIAANNIADYEAWCQNQHVDNPTGLLVNWFQTTRESYCVSDEYKMMLEKILSGKTNIWDRTFNYLPLAEQNRMRAQMSEEAWLRSVWYNDYLNDKQTPETYAQLPAVTDPEDDTCTLEYKANALGIFTILGENQRVIDMNGKALDLDAIFEQLYALKQYRSVDGDQVHVIDTMTDRKTANLIFETMAKYYKARYGWDTTRFANLGQKVEYNGQVSFEYDLYDIPDASLQWAVFREPFFDDQLDAFSQTASMPENFNSRARTLWFIDWSDVNIGIGGTKSVVRMNPDVKTSELYKCRISANVKEHNLRSTKWTTMVDRPRRHLIIHNFDLTCPTVTAGANCSVPNP